MRRGFTLVELLVIIAIIGVLSAIVLVSLNIARANGRIAAAKKFDATVLHALGDYMVGEWRFEEGSGTTAYDTSGSANQGTLVNTPTWTTGVKGGALQFNGTTQYIQTNSSVVPVGGSAYTVSVWFISDDQTTGHRELVSQWTGPNANNSFFLGTTQNSHIRFSDNWNDVDIGNWTTGEWHQVTVVSSNNNAYIYFDGSLKATRGSALTYTGTGPFVIGRQAAFASEYWKGKIDEVHVFTKTLTATEVERLYAEGRKTHPFATK